VDSILVKPTIEGFIKPKNLRMQWNTDQTSEKEKRKKKGENAFQKMKHP
jgi:hypothetical protein